MYTVRLSACLSLVILAKLKKIIIIRVYCSSNRLFVCDYSGKAYTKPFIYLSSHHLFCSSNCLFVYNYSGKTKNKYTFILFI